MRFRRLSLTLLLLALSGLLSACNTVAGFGRDVQKLGEKVEDTARKK